MPETLTLDVLRAAVGGDAVAIRSVTRLQPAGGPGDKVFPPTYAKDGNATTRYAMETRRIDGEDVTTVLLDSVASQANRMEQALLAAWRDEALSFPVIAVDFSGQEGLEDIGEITTLDAPHRIADAILRDSVLRDSVLPDSTDDGAGGLVPFRRTPIGKAFTDARPTAATAVYTACPTALVFGVWDSTGPKGGLGAKFQRALVSEIVGVGATPGVKTASRIDPLGIQGNVPLYHRADDHDDWTASEEEAAKKKGKPELFNRSGGEGKGKPSAVNHSNVTPTIDAEAGGVTIDYAVHTAVLSLPALRRLQFVTDADGRPFADRPARRRAERAARTALAALAIAAIVHQRQEGYDLRSRALLVPEGPLELELVPADGGEGRRYRLSPDEADALVAAAAVEAAAAGLPWQRRPLVLQPAPKLSDLVR
ncbi:MAG: type I-U CRISPR-associated protein Cas7, partial [Deltaproteobacteria bacterium]